MAEQEARRPKAEDVDAIANELRIPAAKANQTPEEPEAAGLITPAASLESAISRVDKSYSSAGPSPQSQNLAEKVAHECSESDCIGTPETTQIARFATFLRQPKELSLGTSNDVNGQVERPSEAVPVFRGNEWVKRILKRYPRSAAGFHAEQEVMVAIKREVAAGRQPSELAAAAWIEQRTKLFAGIVALWPKSEHRFIPAALSFYERGIYADDHNTWRRDAPA